MPSFDALKSGLFCSQCGEDKPAEQLKILWASVPLGIGKDMKWRRAGRYCVTCIPGREEQVKTEFPGIEIQFEHRLFIPVSQERNSGRKVESK